MAKHVHSKGIFELSRSGRDVDELLLRINRLVHARELLRRNGGGATEVQAKTTEIARLQWRLARVGAAS
jgi:hypothetical protein